MYLGLAPSVSIPASPAKPSQSLTRLALWYPDIPPPHLTLNEHSFTGRSSAAMEYSPFVWSQFGGLSGEVLRHMTGISVMQLGSLCSIYFRYNIETIDLRHARLGRRAQTDFSRMIDFAIDGPQGERITSIEASLAKVSSECTIPFCQDGILESLKVTYSTLLRTSSANLYSDCDHRSLHHGTDHATFFPGA